MNSLIDIKSAGRRTALLVLAIATLLLLFRDTAGAMVTIWLRSETFTHAFLVPPIVLWLVWRQRHALAAIEPRPMPWVLLPMAAVCGLWLLGELASVNAATQLALATLIVLCVPALFGAAVTRTILFPLAFLYFAVPVGEFLVPQMMEWTADVTVLALRWTGIPVYREGLQFVIPSGNWSVIQACSGVRYLIASFMVGTLFAYLNYRSMLRRVAFMAVAIAVPIVANWVRAYIIVMLGHLSGNRIAAGVDHLVYGWVFFGVVILAMFMIGARWAEAEADPVAATTAPATARTTAAAWATLFGIVGLLVATQATAWHLGGAADGAPPRLALPERSGDWAAQASALSDWPPAFQNPDAVAARDYRAGADVAGVWVGYYRNQRFGHTLVTSTNMLVDYQKADWVQVSSGSASLDREGGPLALRRAELRSSAAPGERAAQRLLVWQLYWVGGRYTASDSEAKLRLALDRLLGRGDDSAVVLMFTPIGDGVDAEVLLRRFAPAYLDALDAALAATRELR